MTYEYDPNSTTPIASGAVVAPQATPLATPTTPEKARFNTLAVVSFALSLLSALGIPAVIIGHFALSDIKKSGERGRVLAILGLVFGYLTIVSAIAFTALFFGLMVEALHRLQQENPDWQNQLDQFQQLQNS